MNITQIEKNVSKLTKKADPKSFIYDLFLAYGLPKSSITRLQKGNLNLSKNTGEISWKKKVLFREEFEEDLHLTISELSKEIKHDQRFVIVTDYETFLAVDTKTDDKLDIAIENLPKHFDFFLPWAGIEKAQHKDENPADVKAAVKMARLFDEIKKDNTDNSPEYTHGLNVFLSRLLFCFFAEDTHIFDENQFTNALDSHTKVDGDDVNKWFNQFFEVLDTPEKERGNLPDYLNAFPYVNGGLFQRRIKSPEFTRRSRQAILDSGDQDWSAINPDIFGSMFQAVVSTDQRGNLGMHYTSVPNIMKVIEPLFLNDLYEEFEKAKGNVKRLEKLLARLKNIKIFDPACGSGNFLIIAYKELRRLEMKIFQKGGMLALSGIHLSQFYGIEIDDFAHEIAKLALWLAEHQMNVEFKEVFGRTNPTLPLKDAGKIVQGNACRIDWEEVCPKDNDSEIFILGNPPYLGGKFQSRQQKEDMIASFIGINKIGELDYIAAWFIKAIKYEPCKVAFVTTSSICQGAQVQQLWPHVFDARFELIFAYKPFYWANNAKCKAAVIVSILGIAKQNAPVKIIYEKAHKKTVINISPYLTAGPNTIVYQRLQPLSNMPTIITGNSPYDGGNLILSEADKLHLLKEYPKSAKFIKRLYGSQDFLNGKSRWCIWITDKCLQEATSIELINTRITKTKNFRRCGGDVARSIANRPHQFRYTYTAIKNLIIIPRVSSQRRKYIPFGFLDADCIISDSAQTIYDPQPFVFGVISSRIHMHWVRNTAGRLKDDFRYSSALSYNTFPFPPISTQRKEEITQCTFRILAEREKHPEKTLAQLYDPDKMPDGLREAHHLNDLAIERCYRSKPFESDEERLEYLFKLYEKMIEEEKNQGTLFEVEKKKRTRKKI